MDTTHASCGRWSAVWSRLRPVLCFYHLTVSSPPPHQTKLDRGANGSTLGSLVHLGSTGRSSHTVGTPLHQPTILFPDIGLCSENSFLGISTDIPFLVYAD
jgi:hypothetical protein